MQIELFKATNTHLETLFTLEIQEKQKVKRQIK